MSDAYQIEGVTITPGGGGYYELSHPSISEPLRVRGKEVAESKAEELGKAAAAGDDTALSTMQGSLDDALGSTDEVAQLKAQLAASEAARLEAEAQTEQLQSQIATRTVVVDDGEAAAPPVHIGAVPRKFSGTLDDTAKANWERLGFPMVDIILEENEAIPPTGLFIGHNGRGYNITPGETVTVPEFLLGVLDNAVMAAPVTDPQSLKVLGYRNRLRYPYRRV